MMLSEMGELFKLSVILHFPPEVYLRRGVGELAPLLVRALHEKELSALQFLRGGRVRATLHDSAYREELLSSDLLFEDTLIPVTPADRPTTSVYLRDLPVEISDGSVRSALEAFGDVFSIRHVMYKDFPSVRNGTRILLMFVKQSIPSSLNVLGFVCRVWYPGQPIICTICRESGHLPRACPLSGLCRRCKQPGHVARECAQVCDPPRPPEPPPDPSPPSSEPIVLPPTESTVSPSAESTVPPSTEPTVPPLVFPSFPVSTPVSFPAPAPSLVLGPPPVPLAPGGEEVVMSSEPSRGPLVPHPLDSSDVKKLTRLLLVKVKPGSDASALSKQAKALCKSQKLSVSESELRRVVDAILL